MELYILDNNDLSTLSILECSDYEINLDNQFTDKSTFRVNKAPGQIKDNFLVVNGLYQQFLFIIDEVEATDKEEKFVNLVCSDISNIFNRKIIEQDTNLMTTRSIEYFLAHMMDVNFVNSDDSVLNKSYINITYTEHTQAKVQTNAENGIYNFHTFMENCREYQNVYVDFSIENKHLNIEIKYKNDTPVTIDTTIPEITHYNKVYEQDITAKVTVYVRETNETFNWYLKTDRTVTTNKNDPNRAAGAIEVISVDTLDVAEQEALNVFKGNTYKHLVEFSMSKNSKLVDTTTLYIGRAIIIKTPDGIYESIISGISLDDDNFVNFKSGNIRITFIDKLKQEQENYGNKLDVTGGTIKGNLTTNGNQTTTGSTTTGTLTSNGNTTIGKTDGSTNFQIHGGSGSNIYWKEYGYGDKFRIIPEFGGADDNNKLRIQGAVGGAGENPSLYDLMTISGKNGHIWVKGSVRIPKSGNNGMGIANSDGVSIIKDYNNQNVTVDATGDTLFLGFSNTKALNFLNGKGSMISNGTITAPNFRGKLETINGRITNANISHAYDNDRAHVQLLQASGTMTSNKPYADGYILHFSWDNTGQYNGQLYVPNSYGHLQFRGCANGSWGSWENIHPIKSLYDNGTGTTGTVTLSESAANFTYLEIFYRKNNNYTNASAYGSVKVYSPNNKKVNLVWGAVEGSTTNQVQFAVKTISGTQITHNNAGYVNFETNAWSRSTNTNEIYIVKVIGYR